MLTNTDRVLGSLYGGAFGDAMGYPIEFSSKTSIDKIQNLSEFPENIYGKGKLLFSDDTQMTLFTLEAILHSYHGNKLMDNMLSAYKYWYNTQGIAKLEYPYSYKSDIAGDPRLNVPRAPGGTCLSALSENKQPDNNSCGCGGVMRVAPIGFVFNVEDSYKYGCEAAKLTHCNIDGYESAGLLAAIISCIFDGDSLINAVKKSSKFLTSENLKNMVKQALKYGKSKASNSYIYERWEGWTGQEAIAMAIFFSVKYDLLYEDKKKGFDNALVCAVSHDGDSDSVGAIVGNILGALYGIEILPYDRRKMDCNDIIDLLGKSI